MRGDPTQNAADPRPLLHRLRLGTGCWMVRLAVRVIPPGAVRDSLRTSCAVWIKLMEVRVHG